MKWRTPTNFGTDEGSHYKILNTPVDLTACLWTSGGRYQTPQGGKDANRTGSCLRPGTLYTPELRHAGTRSDTSAVFMCLDVRYEKSSRMIAAAYQKMRGMR